jgi:endonuclease G
MKKLFPSPWRIIFLLLVGLLVGTALSFFLHFIFNRPDSPKPIPQTGETSVPSSPSPLPPNPSPPSPLPPNPSPPSPLPSNPSTSVHLALGNPSNADKNQFNNFLMEKEQFVLSYNSAKGTPNWVSWQLNGKWLGDFPRPKPDPFHPDIFPSNKFNKLTGKEYKGSVYHRGHMVPFADRNNNKEDAHSTFVMTNIFPQAPSVNKGYWSRLETYSRNLVKQGNELYIISGVYGQKELIANGKVAVPSWLYKIIVVIPPGSDINQINDSTRVIAVEIPNKNESNDADWRSFTTTVDQIEKHTEYEFLSSVSKPIQDVIESKVDTEIILAPPTPTPTPTATPTPTPTLTPTATPIPSGAILLPSGVTVNHKNPNYVMCQEIEQVNGRKSDAEWLKDKGWLNPAATATCAKLD